MATSFAIRSTYHTTLKKTPGQLAFGRDMMFNISHSANWDYIQKLKQRVIKKNNKSENSKRIPHIYLAGDQVMLKIGTENKYKTPYSGPHTIQKVFNNGTVCLRIGAVTDTVNIRRIDPYSASSDSIHGGNAVCMSPRIEGQTERLPN